MADEYRTIDLWVAGTEEPELQPTDEGTQEIASEESPRLRSVFSCIFEITRS